MREHVGDSSVISDIDVVVHKAYLNMLTPVLSVTCE
jgi:hypothetical protein